MPLNLVPVIVARTKNTHMGGGDYAEVEAAIPGSPFLARVYRTAQKSFLPDEAATGTATVDEQRRLSVMNPACPIQVDDIAFLPEANGSYTRAKVIRCRPYGDRCQYDLETGAEGNAPPPAGVDVAEASSADAANAGPAAVSAPAGQDIAEFSTADAAG